MDDQMFLWVWTGHPLVWSDLLVCVYAPNEETAWKILHDECKHTWECLRRGMYSSQHLDNDSRPCDELQAFCRPVKVDKPEAFVLWGE